MSEVRVKFATEDPQAEKEHEVKYAEAAQNRADIAYLSMMTGIDLDEEEEEE